MLMLVNVLIATVVAVTEAVRVEITGASNVEVTVIVASGTGKTSEQ